MNQFKGECLCGECRYAITGDKPIAMYLCHCSRCRKETGTSYGANVFFKNAELRWEKGSENITLFKLKGTRKQRAFCNTCGSPLPRVDESSQGNLSVILPAGTLDEEYEAFLHPTAHIYHMSRSSWEDTVNDLERFNEGPNN